MYRRVLDTIGWAVGAQDENENDNESETHSQSQALPPLAHFVFLVHGFMGNDTELSYLEEAIEEAIKKEKSNDDDGGGSANLEVVVYRVRCNNTSTFDGIEAGGSRLATEVKDFVGAYIIERRRNGTLPANDAYVHATISFFGYSLGGLYSRYAISLLPFEFEAAEPNTGTSDNAKVILHPNTVELNTGTSGNTKVVLHLNTVEANTATSGNANVILHPNTFCTAATPHLGIAAHTYFLLPRCMEYMLAYSFGKTGCDLFRVNRRKRRQYFGCGNEQSADGPNDLVYAMATQEAYLAPLSTFKRRISFINAFGTDFQVPTTTAGMLSIHSDSPHYFSKESYKWNIEDVDALVFETKQSKTPLGLQSSGTRSHKSDEALTMALNLDALGWKKVFVDCRKGMTCPGIPLPRICRRPRKEMIDSLITKRRRSLSQRDDSNNSGIVFESKELCSLMRKSEQLHLVPTGHFIIVAHSKSRNGSKMSAKGRPFVRQAAVDLVNDMKTFQV